MKYFVLLLCSGFLFVLSAEPRNASLELQLFKWSYDVRPYWATSEYQTSHNPVGQIPIDGEFGPGKALDGLPGTMWIPGGARKGIGESLYFAVKTDFRGFRIAAGAPARYEINRPASLSVTFFVAFGAPGNESDITRFYKAYQAGDKVQVSLENTASLQEVSFLPDWISAQDLVRKRAEETARFYDILLVDLEIRYVIKIDIEEVYGEREQTGIAEVIPLRGEEPDSFQTYWSLMDRKMKERVNPFLTLKWTDFAQYCEAGDVLKAAAFLAPEALMEETGLYYEDLDTKDLPVLEEFFSGLFFPDEELSWADISEIRYVDYQLLRGKEQPYPILKARVLTKKGTYTSFVLAVQPETGLFIRP